MTTCLTQQCVSNGFRHRRVLALEKGPKASIDAFSWRGGFATQVTSTNIFRLLDAAWDDMAWWSMVLHGMVWFGMA
jgi:hypothetical protein